MLPEDPATGENEMVNPVRLTSKLLVSSQIAPEDLPSLDALGIRTIVCNRPDGEGASQPSAETLEQTARDLGMTFTSLPMTPKFEMREGDAARFGEILDGAQGEVLAFCRTGKRSVSMWARSQLGKLETAEIERVAAQSGFDVADYLERVLDEEAMPAARPPTVHEAPNRGWFKWLTGSR